MSLGDGAGFFNILIRWHLVFLDGGVDSGLRNLEGILGPCLDIQVRGFLFGDVELFDKVEGSLSEILPIIITEWKVSIASKLVSNGVPDGVEISGSRPVR